ncbi:MAG: HlyD family secretion protein [Oscillospiraceae bacterium]|nr:HlyD family secretion protein [Oscillospiraceae bacterium]
MKDIKVTKRNWVKNVALIFMAVMLLLTFFSNTILNRSLPEVAAQYTSSGTITARIRGSGTATAVENFEVILTARRTVSEVPVRLGDEVSAGDVIIRLSGGDSAELGMAREELRTLERALEEKLLNSSLDDNMFAVQNRNIQRMRANLSTAQAELAGISYNEDAYNQAVSDVSAAESAVTANEFERAMAQIEIETLQAAGIASDSPEMIQAETALSNAEIALARANAIFSEAQSRLSPLATSRAAWQSASDTVKSLQQSLEDALFDLAEDQRRAGIMSSISAIDLRELRTQIDDKKAEIIELEKDDTGTEITSAVNGIVTQINVTPGKETDGSDTPLMIIENVDRGYTLSFSVSADQATKVRVGDMAEVDRGWWSWGEPITAILTSIRNNPQEPITSRILEFSLSGDIESGSNLNITISQRTENYNIVVPNGAIRSDTNGTFVLVIESRSSPLGNRYVATRADVNVLASDDTQTAVSGALTGWDFIILTSNRPIEPGMQVRLVDNP